MTLQVISQLHWRFPGSLALHAGLEYAPTVTRPASSGRSPTVNLLFSLAPLVVSSLLMAHIAVASVPGQLMHTVDPPPLAFRNMGQMKDVLVLAALVGMCTGTIPLSSAHVVL